MESQSEGNHREFSRVTVHVEARIKSGDQEVRSDRTEDISMKGLFIACEPVLKQGAHCEIILTLRGADNPVEVKMNGTVSRVTDDGLAIQFTELGLEAYDHLHNIVLLNAEDTDKVEKEFKDHLGLKKR